MEGSPDLPPVDPNADSPVGKAGTNGKAAGSGSGGVRLEGVTKQFGDFTAVQEMELDIADGEFFTMLGPSGCGKTTTLRMIAGFDQPTTGRVLIDGTDVAGLPAYKRPTNTVFQSYALFPHMTLEENVGFGLKRKKVDKGEIRRRVGEELERVGLSREAKRKPNQLSGGQQQRVALARALVNLPKVLLLDEPLGALDLKLRKGLQVQLKQIQRDVGITFVYVTHDQEEALTMSDRIAVMNEGRIEQCDDPETVYEHPSTTFVAGFIGVSNLMPAIASSSSEIKLDAGPAISTPEASRFGQGERCYAVVRPEKLEIDLEGQAGTDRPGVDGVVESSLYLGTATQMAVRVDEEVSMTVLCPNVSDEERQGLPGAGARVRLSWLPDHMHLVAESDPGKADDDQSNTEAAAKGVSK
ncbi:MAG: ABC transporter ATP-binding protein [Solirubrobacterales bacterium]|nr:ABC transporter ATP-binding protein [Solirubrobacterales bacterium]